MSFAMNAIEIDIDRLCSLDRPQVKLAEMVLLCVVWEQSSEITFQKRGRFIFPQCLCDDCPTSLEPFPAHLGGPAFNHFRSLCGIRFPTQRGWFTITINGRTAEFQLIISPNTPGSFATLTLLDCSAKWEDAGAVLRGYFRKSDSKKTIIRRIWEDIRYWWQGNNLHRIYPNAV